MKVVLSGATGLIGTELQQFLTAHGHEVIRLVRHRVDLTGNTLFWDQENEVIDSAGLEDVDAVIHLAGENIFGGRWTKQRKQDILDSRVQGTKLLTDALCHLKHPPKTFICGSAIGIYGDRGDEICDENTPTGTGFLADVCRQWEEATTPASEKGIRVVNLRTGIVLSPKGGAFAKMLSPFKLGLGGMIGSGKQYVSWIAIDDLVSIILFILNNESIKGPVNAVEPNPVTNEELTKTLGKVLNRPTFLAAPEFALRLVLGDEMADESLLSSTRVVPMKLEEAGYVFLYPELKGALIHLLNKENEMATQLETHKSDKSFWATLLFCLLLGTLGVHRFYVGKIGTGILMLLTLGGFGIWMLIDFILIACCRFRDKQGFLIEP